MDKQLLNKIYEAIYDNKPSFLDSCRDVDAEIRKIVEEYNGTLDKKEVERLSDAFVPVISTARRDGFKSGLKLALRLMAEILMD